jgi:hypothetical protein
MACISRNLLLVVGLTVAAAPLAGQQPASRPALWLSAGVGLGWARVTCRICDANRGHGLSGYAQAGGRISRRVLVGGEVQGWLRNGNAEQGNPADELLLAYSAVIYWYPSPRYPYYLKSGFGLVTYRIDDGTDRLTSSALGPQIGIGWEVRAVSHFSLVPYVNVLVASTGAELKFNGNEVLGNASLALIQFGIGVARR